METQPEPAKQQYLFKTCENRHCHVIIGWRVGTLQGSIMCKHCQSGVAHWQKEAQSVRPVKIVGAV